MSGRRRERLYVGIICCSQPLAHEENLDVMSTDSKEERKEIFVFSDELSGFDDGVTDLIRRQIDLQREELIPPENVIAYSHGQGWLTNEPQNSLGEEKFKTLSHEELIKFQNIVGHDLSIVPTYILAMIKAIHDGIIKSMFEKIHEATEKTGNVVNAKELGSPAEAFLEALRKIEFGVSRDGTVSRPTFHLSPKMHETFMAELEAQGEEFKKKVEAITAAKEKTALEREAERKKKFVKPTETE